MFIVRGIFVIVLKREAGGGSIVCLQECREKKEAG